MQAMPEPVPSTLPPTLQFLARRWWLVLLRGVVAILFGFLAALWPGLTILTLVVLYGAFAFTDGILALAAAIAGRGPSSARWWLVLSGLLGIAVGVVAVISPGAVAFALLILIAATAIALGAMQIVAAIQMRKEIAHEWLLIVAGVVSILFGIVLLAQPGAGAIAIAWMVAAYAVASGVVYIAWSLRLRKWHNTTTGAPAAS